MRQLTAQEIKELDRLAIQTYGVPSIALMENAGRSIAFEVLKVLKWKRQPRICVVCGVGNNAGDGLVAARHLINAGALVTVFLIGMPRQLKHDAAIQYKILKKLKYPMYEGRLNATLKKHLSSADIVIDALFGVGLNRAVTEPFASVMAAMNASAKHVVSADVPSGLDATTGRVHGVCVKAHTTVTFSFAKAGFTIEEGPQHTGRVKVVDIGIPDKVKARFQSKRRPRVKTSSVTPINPVDMLQEYDNLA